MIRLGRRAALGGTLATIACAARRDGARAREPDGFAALSGLCDAAVAPGPAAWARRRAAVQTAMREAAIALVVCEPGPSLAYLVGMAGHRSERAWLLGLPAEGPARLVCPAFERRSALEQLDDAIELVTWREHEDPFAALRDEFADIGDAAVAIEPSTRSFVAAGITRVFPRAVAADPIGDARRCKQPEELALLRIADIATQAAIAAVASRVAIGIRQSQIAAWIDEALRAAGLSEPWVLALVGPNASFPHGTAEDRVVARGDVVLVDTGAALHGYRSDITRTWCVGEPSPRVRSIWEAVARAQQAAHAAIAPGVSAGAIDAAARTSIAAAGFGPDDRFFTHRLGHGIGLEVHEPPYLVAGSDVVLAPGMTMSNEPGIYVPGELGVRLEDIVVVTPRGAEVLGGYAPSLERPFAR